MAFKFVVFVTAWVLATFGLAADLEDINHGLIKDTADAGENSLASFGLLFPRQDVTTVTVTVTECFSSSVPASYSIPSTTSATTTTPTWATESSSTLCTWSHTSESAVPSTSDSWTSTTTSSALSTSSVVVPSTTTSETSSTFDSQTTTSTTVPSSSSEAGDGATTTSDPSASATSFPNHASHQTGMHGNLLALAAVLVGLLVM